MLWPCSFHPVRVSVPIGCGCCRLLTRAGLMSLVDVSAGDSWGFFFSSFLEGWALFGWWMLRAPHTSRFDVICDLWPLCHQPVTGQVLFFSTQYTNLALITVRVGEQLPLLSIWFRRSCNAMPCSTRETWTDCWGRLSSYVCAQAHMVHTNRFDAKCDT